MLSRDVVLAGFGCRAVSCSLVFLALSAAAEEGRSAKFRDPEDGCIDLSKFLDDPHGFVPLVQPITEPALGFGVLVAPMFIQSNDPASDGRKVRPNLATVGGFTTEGGSKGVFGLWSAAWMEGRLETKVGGVNASMNLDYYGAGLPVGPGLNSLSYELDMKGGALEGKYRIEDSPWMLGLRYLYAEMDSTFQFRLPAGIRSAELDSTLAGPSMIVSYDTRNSIFTPEKGNYFDFSATFHDPAFGASSSHQRYDLVGLHFRPLADRWFFGVKGEAKLSTGDTPFYALPYVDLRGVPAQRYQGEFAASLEAEIRWQFLNRMSLVGFAGVGAAGNDPGDLGDTIIAGGAGVRYELARRYDLHMGLDVGVSEEDVAVYVILGSAWFRP